MKRSPMQRSAKPMKRGKPLARKTPMRSRPKRRAKVDGIDYLGLCRGQECFLRLPMVRFHDRETVVPAHRNEGKGMGLKVPDEFTVPSCHLCHMAYDQGGQMTREEKRAAWNAAFARWSKYRETIINKEHQ